jgi:hypothetical protein
LTHPFLCAYKLLHRQMQPSCMPCTSLHDPTPVFFLFSDISGFSRVILRGVTIFLYLFLLRVPLYPPFAFCGSLTLNMRGLFFVFCIFACPANHCSQILSYFAFFRPLLFSMRRPLFTIARQQPIAAIMTDAGFVSCCWLMPAGLTKPGISSSQ